MISRSCWPSIRCHAVGFTLVPWLDGLRSSWAPCSWSLTGAEALYADMGHFGRKPIRAAWLAFVLPALALNYLGQGAYVLRSPKAPTIRSSA